MRYLPHTEKDRTAILQTIGAASADDLFRDVPTEFLLTAPIQDLPLHQSEMAVERHMASLANQNLNAGNTAFFCGAGTYKHHIPSLVDYMIQRGEFLTSYTPYQPEVSQGTLQYLFEFQTQVCLLTGMEVANASMYDGSTACNEAVLMANRITKRNHAVLTGGLHPHYRDVVTTQARWTGFSTDEILSNASLDDVIAKIDDQTSCVVAQCPDFFGNVFDYRALADACHAKGALLIIVVTEIISLGLLPPPGDMDADIVVAEGQSLGNPMNFGGPHVGLFATRDKYVRQMPGRLCGETIDADGKRGFVLTLSTREQHIRREKATSNICTNAGLCALAFTIHLTLLGDKGLRHLAAFNHARMTQLAERIRTIKTLRVINDTFFNELTIELPCDAAMFVENAAKKNILAGVPLSRLYPDDNAMKNKLLVAVTETATDDDMEKLAGLLEAAG